MCKWVAFAQGEPSDSYHSTFTLHGLWPGVSATLLDTAGCKDICNKRLQRGAHAMKKHNCDIQFVYKLPIIRSKHA